MVSHEWRTMEEETWLSLPTWTRYWTMSERTKARAEVLMAPVNALQGVNDGDAEALKQAFGVKTVGDLGKKMFFRAAQALAGAIR